MGTDGVVDSFPGAQLLVEGCNIPGELRHLVELFRVGSLPPLHAAVEVRSPGREHIEGNAEQTASLLKLPFELTATINLDTPHGKRCAVQEVFQECSGSS